MPVELGAKPLLLLVRLSSASFDPLDSASVFLVPSDVVDVCLDAAGVFGWSVEAPNLGRSADDVGVEGTLLSVFLAPASAEAELADASCPLFCFFILAISSSSLTWRDVVTRGTRADGLDSGCEIVVVGKLSVVGGVGFLRRPFSISCMRLMTRGESASRVMPLSGPLAASSVSSTLWRSFLLAAATSGPLSFWWKRTERPDGSLSESPESWWRMNRERKRVRRPLSAGESS